MRISGITYAHKRSHKTRNIFIFAIVTILIMVILIMSYSSIVGWKLTHPKRDAIPAFSSNTVPEFKDANFTDINKTVNLKGWLFEAKGSDKTVIFAHGYAYSRLQFGDKTLDLVKSFLEKGYNILLFDFRNSGISGGKMTSVGIYEKDDLLGAVKYVKSQGAKHVVLLGFSMGASTSIVTASESQDVDAVIADSPFADLNEYLNENLPVWSKLPAFPFNKTILSSAKVLTGLDPTKFSPKKVITKFSPKPILFIHSNDDKKIPIENSMELFSIYSKVAGDKAEFWQTQGVDHVGSYKSYPQDYIDRVFKFLNGVYPKKN